MKIPAKIWILWILGATLSQAVLGAADLAEVEASKQVKEVVEAQEKVVLANMEMFPILILEFILEGINPGEIPRKLYLTPTQLRQSVTKKISNSKFDEESKNLLQHIIINQIPEEDLDKMLDSTIEKEKLDSLRVQIKDLKENISQKEAELKKVLEKLDKQKSPAFDKAFLEKYKKREHEFTEVKAKEFALRYLEEKSLGELADHVTKYIAAQNATHEKVLKYTEEKILNIMAEGLAKAVNADPMVSKHVKEYFVKEASHLTDLVESLFKDFDFDDLAVDLLVEDRKKAVEERSKQSFKAFYEVIASAKKEVDGTLLTGIFVQNHLDEVIQSHPEGLPNPGVKSPLRGAKGCSSATPLKATPSKKETGQSQDPSINVQPSENDSEPELEEPTASSKDRKEPKPLGPVSNAAASTGLSRTQLVLIVTVIVAAVAATGYFTHKYFAAKRRQEAQAY